MTAESPGFQPVAQDGVRLGVGQTLDVTIQLPILALTETVAVTGTSMRIAASTEARLADTFGRTEIHELPLPQRDIFLLPKLSAGATAIPGAASSTKLSSSPVVTVNGNRYRGNNYVLDGAMNTNPNNSGEPAIVPSLESVDEVQVQTLNFASEFGRGNGAVINIQTRSGTNQLRGRVWEYHRHAALNAANYFATDRPPQVFNQFGANIGGPLRHNRTFFFGSYEGTRNDIGRSYAFQVETPELRDYVLQHAPSSVAARLLREFPAPTPLPGVNGSRYLDQRDLATPAGPIPAIGRAAVTIEDSIRFDQYMVRLDHTITDRDRVSARWIAEHQSDEGGTSSSQTTLGRALRGSRGPFSGVFGNLNLGYTKILGRLAERCARRRAVDQREARRSGCDRSAGDDHRHHRAVRRRVHRSEPAAHAGVPRHPDARSRQPRDPHGRRSAPHHEDACGRTAAGRHVRVQQPRRFRRRSAVPSDAHRGSRPPASRPASRATSRSTRPARSCRISGGSGRASASASGCGTTTSAPYRSAKAACRRSCSARARPSAISSRRRRSCASIVSIVPR